MAPSKRPALACSAPRDSEPQIGCPPTNRRELPAAATTLPLVEPTSVTVVAVACRLEHATTWPGRWAIGAATTQMSASATASSSVAAAVTAPRATAAASASGSGS